MPISTLWPIPVAAGKYDSFPVPYIPPIAQNVLTPARSSFEDGSTGNLTINTGCTIANSTAQAYDGQCCVALTTTSTSTNMSVQPNTTQQTAYPGLTYTACCSFLAATASRPCQIIFYFLDSGPSIIGTNPSPIVNDVTDHWITLIASGTAPAATVYTTVAINVGQPFAAIGEVHYIDRIRIGY